MAYHVPISAIPLLQDPPFVLWLVWLATGIGWRVLRVIRAPLETITALERGVLSAAVGLGLLPFLPFCLGMLGVLLGRSTLTPLAIRIGLILLTALFLREMLRVAGGVWRVARTLPQARPPAWMVFCLLALVVPLGAAAVQALTPVTDYDGLYYHLAAPKRWLQWGRLAYLPTLVHTNSPMAVEMLFTLPMAIWSDTAAKLIHYAFGVLTILATFALGRRLQNAAVGLTAALLFTLGLPIIHFAALPVFSSAYVDLGVAFQITCAMLAWILWLRSRQGGWLLCAALCAGFAASCKLTGAFVGVVLGGLTLGALLRAGTPPRRATQAAVAFTAASQLPMLPWLWRSWLVTGNPFFPLLSGLFPTRDWSAEAAAGFTNYFKYYNWGLGHADWSLAHRKLMVAAALGMTALAVGLAFRRWRWREGRALVAVIGALALVCLWTTGLYLRFFLPLHPLIFVALCLSVGGALSTRRWAQGTVVALALLGALTYLRAMLPGLKMAYCAASGTLSRDTYLAQNLPISRLWEVINANVPSDAAVLTVGRAPAYYSDPYCYTTFCYGRQRFRLDTWEHFYSDVQRDRIRYLVLAGDHTYDANPNPPTRNEVPFATRLAREQGRLMFTKGYDQLYALKNLSAASTIR